jgi:hypothetical protein
MLKFFHQTGDHQGKHNLPDEPMTDPITGLLFAVGVAYAILAWRDHRRVLLVFWLVIGLSGSFLSSHHESPQSYRSLTALPSVVIIAADVLDRLIRALYGAAHAGALHRSHLPKLLTAGIAFTGMAGAALWESSVYFGPQASSLAVLRGFNPTENQVAHETIAGIQVGKTIYLSPSFSQYSPLRFLVYGVIKAMSGESTLDNPPYHTILPEVDFPIPDDGHDALILLDSKYWSLRDYISSFYPHARMELVELADNDPVYMRVEVPRADLVALHGLNQRITYENGRQELRVVSHVDSTGLNTPTTEVIWEGAIRLEHGGEYDFVARGGLQVFVDGRQWSGPRYLGRGVYGLRAVWRGEATDDPHLVWQTNNQDPVPVPPEALFNITWPTSGLMGSYFHNHNWEGRPVFQQVTPFLLLAWPDEQPIVSSGEFSARYTGALRVSRSGKYGFRIYADDGARLTLDGDVLAEGLVSNQPNNFEVEIELATGDHLIQIDYFQSGGGSALDVFWRYGDEPWSPIPPAVLVPVER